MIGDLLMKVLFLHGAIKNSGDFLIAHRSQKLIKQIVPSCEIDALWEGESESVIKKHLSGISGIVFGGGPFFTNHIYPRDIPLVSDLSELNLPMINVGGGWYGADNRYDSVVNYEIDDTSLELLRRIESSAGCLSCRDWYTVNMLKKKGLMAEMHGCPAWYDIETVPISKLRTTGVINKICISDPASTINYRMAVEVIGLLRKLYPSAEIVFVFHRGTWEKEEGRRGEKRRAIIEPMLTKNKIEYVDIARGYNGFSVYDDCDLHVGFRVHAHIYNLSKRNRTILLEEDGRGAGVNQALGLNSIHVYDDRMQFKPVALRRIKNKISPSLNGYLLEEIINCIDRNEYNNWIEYELAFKRMQFYYDQMCCHISKIKEW